MERLHYIYSHTDLAGVVRYIGQGVCNEKRPKSRAKAFGAKHRSKEWYDFFSDTKPVVTIIEDGIPHDIINEREKYWIDFYGGARINNPDTPLLNLINPVYANEEERQKGLKKYLEKWYADNRDRILDKMHKFKEENYELYLERKRLNHHKHREENNRKCRERRQRNKEKYKIKDHEKYLRNRERLMNERKEKAKQRLEERMQREILLLPEQERLKLWKRREQDKMYKEKKKNGIPIRKYERKND